MVDRQGGEARNHEEVEAVGRALADMANARDREEVRRGDSPRHVPLNYEDWRAEYDEEAEAAIAALDAVRRSPKDEDAERCEHCGLFYDEDSAGAECSRLEADILDIHDALADPDEPSAINVQWIIEQIETLKASRPPQGEDHDIRREISKNAPLRERIADELAHNDECGPGPVSWQEYLADADAILRIVGEHGPQGEDHEAAERAGMEAGCDEADRLGYGSEMGYVEAASISQKAIAAYLSRCPFPERDQLTRLIAGIQWVRGMCSDEEPYEVIDAKLAELLDEDHETSDAVRGDPCGTPVEWPGRQPTDPDRGQLRDAAIPASGRGRQSGQGEDHEAGMVGRPDCEDCGIAQALRADLVALRSRASASERDTEKNALQALVDEARADDEWVSGNDLLIRVGAIVLDRLAGLAGEPTEGADT